VGFVGISAIGDQSCNIVPEPCADFLEPRQRALIFDRVVQQRGNCLILVCPVFQSDCGDGKKVGDIRDTASLASLLAVNTAGVGERIIEAVGEEWVIGL